MKLNEREHTTETHVAEEGDRVAFYLADPDFPDRKNKVEVFIAPSGRLEIYADHNLAVHPGAANSIQVRARRLRG